MSSRALARGLVLFVLATPAVAGAETLKAKDVLSLAMRRNPQFAAVVSDVAQARAAVASEEARYDPTLVMTLGVTHTQTPNLTNVGVNIGTSDIVQGDATFTKKLSFGTELSASVGVTWTQTAMPLFLGMAGSQGTGASASPTPVVLTLGPGYLGSVKLGATQPLLRGAGPTVVLAQLRQAEVQRSAAELTRDRQASTLARDLLTAYWELWYASTAIEVDRIARDTALRQRDEADARRETGSLAPADVLTFETQLATKEETLRQAELERRLRANELARLMGDEDPTGVDVAEEPPSDAELGELGGDLQKRAVEQSPELREQEANVKLAEVKEQAAADSYRSRLDLDAYVQAQGLGNNDIPAALRQLAGLGVLSAHAGLTYELPLSSDRLTAERARAFAATDGARHLRASTRQTLRADVDTAIQKRQVAKDRVRLAERTVDVATRQLEAEQARFASGSGTALEVIQAQDQVQGARLRFARARADLLQAHFSLSHLVGALVPAVADMVARR